MRDPEFEAWTKKAVGEDAATKEVEEYSPHPLLELLRLCAPVLSYDPVPNFGDQPCFLDHSVSPKFVDSTWLCSSDSCSPSHSFLKYSDQLDFIFTFLNARGTVQNMIIWIGDFSPFLPLIVICVPWRQSQAPMSDAQCSKVNVERIVFQR